MKKKIKVLHLLQSDKFSGAENVVCQIINMFKKNEHVEMVYCSKDGPIRETLQKYGVPFLPMEKLSLKEANRVIREYKPDIIHAHDASASVISAFLFKKCPMVSHMHNNPPWIKINGLKSILYYISSFRFGKVLTVSDSIMSEYIYGKKLLKNTITVGNPIDAQSIRESAILFEGENVSYDVAFVGRLTPQKNPKRFINIINLLKENMPEISVIMVGDGQLRDECIMHIKELGLEKNIKLTGFVENPYNLLSKAKLLCMTSDWEGYGLVATEALSLGLPVVCTPVGGLPKLVNESCGMLCNSDTEFLNEIQKLLNNPSYRSEKAKSALVQSNSLSNLDFYKKDLTRIYNEIGENICIPKV